MGGLARALVGAAPAPAAAGDDDAAWLTNSRGYGGSIVRFQSFGWWRPSVLCHRHFTVNVGASLEMTVPVFIGSLNVNTII